MVDRRSPGLDRVEGTAKLTGAERYVDDLPFDGLWGMTVRSPASRGRIRAIRRDPSFDWSDVVVADARDIPGENTVHLIERDQPVLAAGIVRHLHEPVLLVAHPSRETARRAARAITIEVDPEPPLLDFTAAPGPTQIQYADDNVFKRIAIEKGDVEAALAGAHRVVEGEYRTGAQEHVYIENQGMLAWEEDGVLVVRGSLQCPYYIQDAMTHALGRDAAGVRVVQAATGGGFGGKEEYPSVIALHAALLALKSGRPVKIVYDRGEDMAVTTKRHPSRVRHRTGIDPEGRLVAQDIEVLLDGGAYVTLSPVVLSRGVIHAAGPYACDNVRIRGRAVFTNSPPYGAFRGFGAPQTHFANERHMDRVAEAAGLDPVELRRRNLIRDGDETATGQVIRDGTDRVALLERAAAEIGWDGSGARDRPSREAASPSPWLRRGKGLVAFHHGAGFTGGGEVTLASRLEVAGLPDGRVEVRSSNVEMGQGTRTIFTRIAAARLGMAPDAIVIADPDTSRVPDSGPTVASRTAMVVGRLVEEACDDLLERAGADAGADVPATLRAWHAAHSGDELTGTAQYHKPAGISWDDATYRGDAYAAYGWAAYAAEVEVDLRTWTARVTDFVAVQEVGAVLDPILARGQVQGGVVQGIGWALLEDCRLEDGAMTNHQLTNYIIPTSDDVPPIRVVFVENPWEGGPMGAKGLGELPMDGPAPAIANAVARALGVDPLEIPLTPERLMALADSGVRVA